ncbi:hypothetical protein H310_14224 [Aphanomyces invadans]|uniref:Uncharacterized protein n=1 Tax=Aphanomyces invadans TaxID=157072 RepID=A0A024TAT6_9STRA|nr:hypothetical protein H310_14224 [Aphanomyces invadans]ETV91129.1 hypothetical protein H310_14224 [Aphanomyces invadans]|eukprot:XP_008880256.1 hypothetical protein H310_14224 [Aphanomyces invadans]
MSSASEDDNDDESFRVLSTDEEIAAFVESDVPSRMDFVQVLLDKISAPASRSIRQSAINDLPFVTDKSANQRQGGLLSLIGFSKWMRFRPPFERILVSLFVPIMERHADKEPQVRGVADLRFLVGVALSSSRSTSIMSSASEDDNDDESFRVLSTDEEIAAFVESDVPSRMDFVQVLLDKISAPASRSIRQSAINDLPWN